MSCSKTPPVSMQNTFDDSSDYGSDFTPDEEALLDELFAKVATQYASGQVDTSTSVNATETSTTATVAAEPQQQLRLSQQAAAFASASVGDIEDCNIDSCGSNNNNNGNYNNDHNGVPSSPSRVPKVLGREKKPDFSWMRRKQFQQAGKTGVLSGRVSGGGDDARDALDYKRLVEHPSSTEGRERNRERDRAREREWVESIAQSTSTDSAVRDTRSPLDRFRRPPNKAFSVSDLVSPAWCELQYWYTLTKFGRKKRTPAMKLGTAVHKTLEDEIYTTVPVEITTKEDAWALRIWNVIQGLRTLRQYGMTRELEVWGLVDGELVNGVIDQLSYECPDPELEATAAEYYADVEAERDAVPEYQMSLSDYLLSPAAGGRELSDLLMGDYADEGRIETSADESPENRQYPPPPEFYSVPRIYLTDIKTRGRRSVPTAKSSSFRPTIFQLQLYYHMLNRLVTSDDVSMELLSSRYQLDPKRPFTDAFISEVGGLNDQYFDVSSSPEFDPDYIPTPDDAHGIFQHESSTRSSSQDSTSLLLEHNNLSDLWKFMKRQLRLTFLLPSSSYKSTDDNNNDKIGGNDNRATTLPPSSSPSIPAESQPATLESYPTTLSPLLTAKFVSSAPPARDAAGPGTSDSRLLGSRSFLFDPATMSSYLSDQMEWWRGHRDPRGVEVMDAWKCRLCEFQDECEWRREKEWAFSRRGRKGGSIDV